MTFWTRLPTSPAVPVKLQPSLFSCIIALSCLTFLQVFPSRALPCEPVNVALAQPSWLWLTPNRGFFSFPATTLLRFCCQKSESIILGTPEEHYCRLIQKSHCGVAVHKTLVLIDTFGLKHIWWLTHKDSFATIMMTPTRLSVQRTMTCPFHPVLNISEVEFLYGSENSRDFMLFSWYFFFWL